MGLFTELKRRNVFRIAGIYAVVAWILMQVAGTLEESLKLPEWFDSVVTAGLMIGFPIALLLAWAFEMTPEGVKRTEELVEGEVVAASKMDGLILLGIVAVLGMGAWQQFGEKENSVVAVKTSVIPEQAGTSSSKPENPIDSRLRGNDDLVSDNSIAVLPFADLSPNKDQEYFSDGMAEEILNVLVRIDALQVTSRTSAFQFKARDIGIPAIAKELKVRHILEGSVRKSGETLRITAQLIDTQNDKHLWSNTFDRPLTTDNIFAIQDEISNAIVEALKNKLGIESTVKLGVKQGTKNLTAYELFLRARPLFQARKKLDQADELLIKAIELDPKFAQAWAVRAALQSLMFEYGFSSTPVEHNDKNGIEFANNALSIDPNTALALAVKAKIRLNANESLRGHYDYSEIISDYKKALIIEPRNPSTLNWIGLAYQLIGFQDLALKHFAQCMEYEPRYKPCVGNYIYAKSTLGDNLDAVNMYLEKLRNGVVSTRDAPFSALAKLNEEVAFISALNSTVLFKDWHRKGEIYDAYKNPKLDHTELTKAAYEYLSEESRKLWYWHFALTPLGYIGPATDDYIDVFGIKHKDINNPKIKSYLKKAGIYDYWQKHGYPPQCRPLGEDDFECD